MVKSLKFNFNYGNCDKSKGRGKRPHYICVLMSYRRLNIAYDMKFPRAFLKSRKSCVAN